MEGLMADPVLRETRVILYSAILLLFTSLAAFAQEKLTASQQAQITAGVDALKSGDLDAAEKAFSDALRSGMKYPLVFHNLGVIAQERGDHAGAIAHFRQAILLQPDYGPSHLLLGSSLLALRRNPQAIQELRRAVKLMPEQAQAHLQLAKAYEASDNWLDAVQQLQKLTEIAPQEPEYAYQLGKAWNKLSGWSYVRMTKLNAGSARLQQALGQEYVIQERYDLALAAYQRASRIDPKLPEIHYAMAMILLEQKRFAEALAEIELEQKLVPESRLAAGLRIKIETAAAGAPSP
jgi:tetratricopeptide (TPR) repeat protein